jgi:transcriptional regulator with XRE-family HTH domain
MRERGLSQRHVALRTGIDHATISRLLGGHRIPSARTLARLARLFGWPPIDVLDP